jgi:hypothetical protein
MVQTSELLEVSMRQAAKLSAPAIRFQCLHVPLNAAFRADLRHELYDSGNDMGKNVLVSPSHGSEHDQPPTSHWGQVHHVGIPIGAGS